MKKYLAIASAFLLIAFLVPITPVNAASGIFYISDGVTGGACESIGTWNPETRECTLTTDITGQIQLVSDNITLDGNGYSLISPSASAQSGGTGVYLVNRKGVVIKNLTIIRFYYGILLPLSSGNEIKNNTIADCLAGVGLYGSSGNIISGNIIRNSTGEGTGVQIQGGSNNNKVENNIITNNYFGIYIASSSSNNTVQFNTIEDISYIGIVVDSYCTNNEVTKNTVARGLVGIVISYANETRIYNNNFIDITQKPWNNQWQNYGNVFNLPAPIGGNYWSDFDTPDEGCNDINNDGFCDAPYTFLNNQDNLPWMQPIDWENQPPVAEAGGSYIGLAGASITLDASASSDPNGGALTYEWDLDNDGEYNDATGITTTISFTQIGEHLISLRVTDAGGLSDTDTTTVTVTDPTLPAIIPTVSGTPGNNDWYLSDVTVSWDISDPESGIASSVGCDPTILTTDTAGDTLTCSATNGAGLSNSNSVTVKIDKTPPTIVASATTDPNTVGWYKDDVTVHFTCNDALSGVPAGACPADQILSAEGAAVASTAQMVTDVAGNTSGDSNVVTVSIDKTVPLISWVSGINDGDSFYFGFVPPAPTCTASDSLSGLDGSCVVNGYAATVGSHTLIATAKDNAGNQSTETRSYSVLGWTLRGFYQPVDMNGVYNIVKNGSTVPLKFEVFSGSTELTDIAYIKSLTYAQTSCDASATTDEIETTAIGGTSLRYDSAAGQFIYNWKTPNTAGKCYRVTMTTIDGSLLVAYFKLK